MPVIPEPYLREVYDGLNDTEAGLLRQYLAQSDDEIRRLETQLKVGPGELLPEARPDSFRRSWRESSKLKIDAVVERPSRIDIIELKDFGRTSFLGQLLMYRYWYEIEYDPDKPLQLRLVTPDINPSSVQPSRFHGVRLEILSPEGRNHYQQGLEASPPFEGLQ
jgi:hypothetical protein